MVLQCSLFFLRCSSNEYCILLTISCVINICLAVNVACWLERGTARRRADDAISAATGNTVCSIVLSPTWKMEWVGGRVGRDRETEREREREKGEEEE